MMRKWWVDHFQAMFDAAPEISKMKGEKES